MGERVDLDNLLVAERERRWRLEALLSGDDIDRFDETIALVRIDAEIQVDLLALSERGRWRLGEI
jgi:hypothetical protein